MFNFQIKGRKWHRKLRLTVLTRVLEMWTTLTVSLFLIDVAASFSTLYDDSYARKLVKVNGASYSSDPADCIKNIAELGSDWQLLKAYETDCTSISFLESKCAYIILKNAVKKEYIISFRGTVGLDQFITELLTAETKQFERYGKINAYFRKAFKVLW